MTSPSHLPQPPTHTILSPRLRLRTARVSDASACLPFISDHETMKYSTSGAVAAGDLEAAENWLRGRVLGEDAFNFVVTLKGEGDTDGGDGGGQGEAVIGMIGSRDWPEVGYLLHPAHTGKGYATEALRALIPAFFTRMTPSPSSSPTTTTITTPLPSFNYIQACTDQDNLASQHVLLKCGFELVERLVGGFESPVLGVRDTVVFRLAREGTKLDGEEEAEKGDGGSGFVPPVQ